MNFLINAWYRKAPWLWLLWPFSLLYRMAACSHKRWQQAQAFSGEVPLVPVIVVGNITAGGTGKTPLVIALCQHLKKQGRQPGIISRGYGGRADSYPLAVTAATPVHRCGDEPVLIADKTGCPVMVAPDRRQALDALICENVVDVVLSDDGLQHYRLPRYLQIAVVDGDRWFGNGLCLPAGPLREPLSRLEQVEYVIVNGGEPKSYPLLQNACSMQVRPISLTNLCSGEKRSFCGQPFDSRETIQAVTALGNPQRFFAALEALPNPVQARSYPDHYRFETRDFAPDQFAPDQPVVMTEKDAVKCLGFATANMWSVQITVELPADFLASIDAKLADLDRVVADYAAQDEWQ